MRLIKDNKIFLRIPKTGSRYIIEYLKYNKLDLDSKKIQFKGPIFAHATNHTTCQASNINKADYFVFTCIRHPVTWYTSCYYSFRHKPWKNGKGIMEVFVERYMQCSYEEYIDNIENYKIEFGKSPLERIFEPFLIEADYICRLENIDSDLKVLFPEATSFPENFGINKQSREHEHKNKDIERIIALEKKYMDDYGYN